ncbi:MAG: nonstructural protein [Microviridae sp.]|nr:MAG: nonstructural protein [Microviridae sp.]
MIYQVLSVYDRAAMAFGRPVFSNSVGAAMRSFQDECNRAEPGNDMQKHPKDFDLFHLGSFEDGSGRFDLFESPKALAHGAQMQLKLDS